ncbi:ABC transporter ATP-binding protein [Cellulosilyticum ruminicola]|uniref:ABC transporter ATP-binding protein n=1 Tax=Cellulosilyticum ruminicola TaxID=425254 RepID=UPI0006D146EE|nr:ATP-binding cassette domain-containing protein [Cellulosilyticum ruminicola]
MLRISHLKKTFNAGTVNEKVAMNDINFTLNPGDFVTIIGSNGAGKSTLFNLISGYFLSDEGKILLDGQDITFMPEYKRAKYIGRLFQDPLKGTAPSMTIEENLALSYSRSKSRFISLGIKKKDKDLFRERLAQLDLGLEDRMKTKMGLLSGGQRQAVTLLMSTLVVPKVLLLDEHTAALDPATADKVLRITKEIVAEKNITTMMITHNIQSALDLGNRTMMMDSGKVILDIKGEGRSQLQVQDLLDLFKKESNKALDNDRILLS